MLCTPFFGCWKNQCLIIWFQQTILTCFKENNTKSVSEQVSEWRRSSIGILVHILFFSFFFGLCITSASLLLRNVNSLYNLNRYLSSFLLEYFILTFDLVLSGNQATQTAKGRQLQQYNEDCRYQEVCVCLLHIRTMWILNCNSILIIIVNVFLSWTDTWTSTLFWVCWVTITSTHHPLKRTGLSSSRVRGSASESSRL